LIWEDGKVKTHEVGGRETVKGNGWDQALGVANGIPSDGVTLIRGAVACAAGGVVLGSFFHKGLGFGDEDKQSLDEHLQAGGATLVVMASVDELNVAKSDLRNLGGTVEDYEVPDETADKVEQATDLQPTADA
jgi:hypothetical protein